MKSIRNLVSPASYGHLGEYMTTALWTKTSNRFGFPFIKVMLREHLENEFKWRYKKVTKEGILVPQKKQTNRRRKRRRKSKKREV